MAKIKHIAIATQDPEKTANFYKDVFGLEEVGKVSGENAEGYYLSDGNVNIAILRFKNETVAGEEFGTGYSGIHHIGFQVDTQHLRTRGFGRRNPCPGTISTRRCTRGWAADMVDATSS
jgi:catechol 2,3-dioxygenase-like lactoylglutathione lyase family enzyme